MHLLHWFNPFFTGLGLGVIAMILHECGHLAAALMLGVRVKDVGMKWNKGLYTVREQGTVHQNLVIALAGPCVNLLLVITAPWFPVFSLANFCYALANMLPIEGSDGYRIAACWRRIRTGEATN
jgi:stage IV sporulation protein FB